MDQRSLACVIGRLLLRCLTGSSAPGRIRPGDDTFNEERLISSYNVYLISMGGVFRGNYWLSRSAEFF